MIDCDVLEADGGTRTASVTGGLPGAGPGARQARAHLGQLAARPEGPSGGDQRGSARGRRRRGRSRLHRGQRGPDVDLNLVATDREHIVEVQGTAEGEAIPRAVLDRMIDARARGAIGSLVKLQKDALIGRGGRRPDPSSASGPRGEPRHAFEADDAGPRHAPTPASSPSCARCSRDLPVDAGVAHRRRALQVRSPRRGRRDLRGQRLDQEGPRRRRGHADGHPRRRLGSRRRRPRRPSRRALGALRARGRDRRREQRGAARGARPRSTTPSAPPASAASSRWSTPTPISTSPSSPRAAARASSPASPRGESGFGYDPLFVVTGQGHAPWPSSPTSAKKAEVSHRGRAALAMRPAIEALIARRLAEAATISGS
jgi:hypothetical protein